MPPRIRNSARALVQNAAGHVLLLKFAFPGIKDSFDPAQTSFWVTPGGGLEVGENFEDALRRELREELGIEIGPNPACLWVQDVSLKDAAGPFISHERFYYVPIAVNSLELRFEAMSDIEKQTYEGFRWWSLAEMQSDRDAIRPRELPELVRQFINSQETGRPLLIESAVSVLIAETSRLSPDTRHPTPSLRRG